MKYNKIFLITGAAGNIGSSLVNQLIKNETNYIYAVDNLITGKKKKLLISKQNLKFIKLDVNEKNQFQKLDKIKKIHYVFHFAALVGVERTLNNPLSVLKDIEGYKNILNLCKNQKVKRVFFSSSSEVYGESVKFPQREIDTPLNSRLPYSVVKNLGEIYFKTYQKKFNIDYTIFRFFNTYGPNQSDDFVVSRFILRAMKNQDIEIYGDGKQTRTFCYIDDNISACLECLHQNMHINSIINIGSDKEIKIIDLAKKIIKITNSKSKIIHLKPLDEGDMKRRLPDITNMKKIIKHKITPIDKGIKLTFNYFKDEK